MRATIFSCPLSDFKYVYPTVIEPCCTTLVLLFAWDFQTSAQNNHPKTEQKHWPLWDHHQHQWTSRRRRGFFRETSKYILLCFALRRGRWKIAHGNSNVTGDDASISHGFLFRGPRWTSPPPTGRLPFNFLPRSSPSYFCHNNYASPRNE
jgi:hypothetical protein